MEAAAWRRPGLADRSSEEADEGGPRNALTAGPDKPTTADSPADRHSFINLRSGLPKGTLRSYVRASPGITPPRSWTGFRWLSAPELGALLRPLQRIEDRGTIEFQADWLWNWRQSVPWTCQRSTIARLLPDAPQRSFVYGYSLVLVEG